MVHSYTIVIIPAYNEEKTIFGVVSSIKEEYPGCTVVVIDDGSSDETSKLAARAGAIILSHPFNMGYGTALQTGYKYAIRHDYRFLIQMDGDGQHDVRDIKVLLENLEGQSCDIALGSRFLGSINYKTSLYRYIGTIFFSCILYLFSGKKITDTTTGFQAMNQKVLKVFARDLFPCDYPDADVIILLSKLGMRIKEVPVRMYNKNEGKSMHANPFKVSYYIFKMILSMCLTVLRKY
ncbi:MAG: glycosyltransferase family 2 protein [Thermodesulfobacteriota bacterium]|nr:glycosyltransferase family 2 protein [Thermodesulfobacteriota bacterium]